MFEKIPALTVWSENYLVLFNRWSKSLPENFFPVSKKIVVKDEYKFGNPSFYQSIKEKILFEIEFLEKEKDGKIVLCSDSDILFTRNTDELYNIACSLCVDFDMVFMREGGNKNHHINKENEVNGGFYFVKNSVEVRDFLKRAANFVWESLGDQVFFNKELPKITSFKWCCLPYEKIAWGTNIYKSNETLVHHAVCCTSISEKIEQQDFIIKKLNLNGTYLNFK